MQSLSEGAGGVQTPIRIDNSAINAKTLIPFLSVGYNKKRVWGLKTGDGHEDPFITDKCTTYYILGIS